MTQEECERLLRYFRAYWLLHHADGRWMRRTDRRKVMDDDSIRFCAEEFVVANANEDETARSTARETPESTA